MYSYFCCSYVFVILMCLRFYCICDFVVFVFLLCLCFCYTCVFVFFCIFVLLYLSICVFVVNEYLCFCCFFLFVYLCFFPFLCICVHPSTLSPLTTYSICEAHWPGPWDSDNTQSVLGNPRIYKYIQNLLEGADWGIFGWHLAEVSVNFCPKCSPTDPCLTIQENSNASKNVLEMNIECMSRP